MKPDDEQMTGARVQMTTKTRHGMVGESEGTRSGRKMDSAEAEVKPSRRPSPDKKGKGKRRQGQAWMTGRDEGLDGKAGLIWA